MTSAEHTMPVTDPRPAADDPMPPRLASTHPWRVTLTKPAPDPELLARVRAGLLRL